MHTRDARLATDLLPGPLPVPRASVQARIRLLIPVRLLPARRDGPLLLADQDASPSRHHLRLRHRRGRASRHRRRDGRAQAVPFLSDRRQSHPLRPSHEVGSHLGSPAATSRARRREPRDWHLQRVLAEAEDGVRVESGEEAVELDALNVICCCQRSWRTISSSSSWVPSVPDKTCGRA